MCTKIKAIKNCFNSKLWFILTRILQKYISNNCIILYFIKKCQWMYYYFYYFSLIFIKIVYKCKILNLYIEHTLYIPQYILKFSLVLVISLFHSPQTLPDALTFGCAHLYIYWYISINHPAVTGIHNYVTSFLLPSFFSFLSPYFLWYFLSIFLTFLPYFSLMAQRFLGKNLNLNKKKCNLKLLLQSNSLNPANIFLTIYEYV